MQRSLFRLIVVLLVFAVQLGGEPLHEALHALTKSDHVASSSGADPSIATSTLSCRFYELWLASFSSSLKGSAGPNISRFALHLDRIVPTADRPDPTSAPLLAARPRGPPLGA